METPPEGVADIGPRRPTVWESDFCCSAEDLWAVEEDCVLWWVAKKRVKKVGEEGTGEERELWKRKRVVGNDSRTL